MLKVRKMKKVVNSILIMMTVFSLTGCTLAIEDPNYYTQTSNKEQNPSDYFIPSGIEFTLEDNSGQEVDVSEYFYVNLACPGQTVFDNCFSADIGKSMSSSGISIHVFDETINDVEQPTIEEITIDVTLYFINDATSWISYRTVFMNNEGDIRYEGSHMTNSASGVTLSGNIESLMPDGTINRLDYTIHFEGIDELQKTIIKQFDKNDNVVEEKVYFIDDTYENITLHEDAEYYVIIEEFVDDEGNLYQERELHHKSETIYHQFMFTNEYGFLTGDYIVINEITYPINNEEIVNE